MTIFTYRLVLWVQLNQKKIKKKIFENFFEKFSEKIEKKFSQGGRVSFLIFPFFDEKIDIA